ncbi:dynein light chain 1, cytoplasmic [Hesseltinella vesiculosa]|uniref:Dynein light chain 1, cytoplasmic n=1 Tax=Hesseltinella vesiculosa TaxID=101127 RepID=A0A1X2GBU8_9FUNG|nr:dynein light chain 1, cytoplasmic [Hesseltinella vesiculosa]
MSESKAVIKSVDMSDEMQQEAVDVTTQALEKYEIEKDIAAHIKREFDKKYGPTWHCVVGRHFGSFVTHAAIQAILQVITIVGLGFIYAKLGYFSMEKQKWLAKLNLVFFTPCLLFSNVSSIISMEKLIAFWPIPVFYYTFSLVFYILSQITTRATGLNPAYRRFVLACMMFQNTNSFPLATISSLAVSEAGKMLFWNDEDTTESVAARGISYTLFFAIFGNLLRWSYGYQLLRRKPEDYDEIVSIEDEEQHAEGRPVLPERDSYLTIPSQDQRIHVPTSSSSSSISDSGSLRMPNRRLSSMTLTASADQDPFLKKRASETTALLPSSTINESSPRGFVGWIKTIARKIDSFMTPPLYAAALALFVGLTPLKPLLWDKSSFLYPSFTKGIETCGKAAVPIILSCLGSQLYSIANDAQSSSAEMRKPVALAVGLRMGIAPMVVTPLVVLFAKYGAAYSLLATDPVFLVMMVVLGSTPVAVNLMQLCQTNGAFEEEMIQVLFWSYGVVCVPLSTLTVFLALKVVDNVL